MKRTIGGAKSVGGCSVFVWFDDINVRGAQKTPLSRRALDGLPVVRYCVGSTDVRNIIG